MILYICMYICIYVSQPIRKKRIEWLWSTKTLIAHILKEVNVFSLTLDLIFLSWEFTPHLWSRKRKTTLSPIRFPFPTSSWIQCFSFTYSQTSTIFQNFIIILFLFFLVVVVYISRHASCMRAAQNLTINQCKEKYTI